MDGTNFFYMTIRIYPLCELRAVFFFVLFVFGCFWTTKNTKYVTKDTKFETRLIYTNSHFFYNTNSSISWRQLLRRNPFICIANGNIKHASKVGVNALVEIVLKHHLLFCFF